MKKGLVNVMSRKYAAIILGMIAAVTSLSGCGTKDTGTESTKSASDAIYGEISEITDDSIVIQVGTMKERNQEKSSGERSEEEEKPEDGNPPSMFTLTGEEKEIGITEDTEIKRQSMGRGFGGGEKPDGEAAGRGKPDEEQTDGENTPEESWDQKPEDEEITQKDLSTGDNVSIILDADGNAAEIIVMSGERDPGGENQKGTDDENTVAETVYTQGTDQVHRS